ncbi:3D domain-containing protein [Kyrpidia tusciae]|uniref:3D domain protein n=1 Tax=Kyrpidia tusciae (strain DSM 2912 / NBRC 15312 / T2) TaxID=562970 RepID=D5WQK6_KYRT2|nr:3D domain-containing protein [Kyrpidia tusciae]ADG06615.1 3D domain protein [Kyrpidia tusciae DSM 2912]
MSPSVWLVLATSLSFGMQSVGIGAFGPSLNHAFSVKSDGGDGVSGLASRSLSPTEAGATVTVHRGDEGSKAQPAPAPGESAAPAPQNSTQGNGRPAEVSEPPAKAPEPAPVKKEVRRTAPKPAATAVSVKPVNRQTVQQQAQAPSQGAVRTMTATVYGPGNSGPYGDVDAFGQPLHVGVVAVDPKVIPLGSRVLIKGFHAPGISQDGFYAVASDMGGAIQGNRIDVFLPLDQEQLLDIGMQQVTVQILGE